MWDLPDINDPSGAATKVLAAVTNDWQLSGIYTGQSGDRYSIGYGYQSGGGNVNVTGSPNYGGRVLITGDPGSGCSDNQYQQFNTGAFSGPPIGSVGLESGQNYLQGCFENFWDLAIARNFRLGGNRIDPAQARDVQRVRHGRVLGEEHHGQHPEPDRPDRDQPAVRRVRQPRPDADSSRRRRIWRRPRMRSRLRSMQAQIRFQF